MTVPSPVTSRLPPLASQSLDSEALPRPLRQQKRSPEEGVARQAERGEAAELDPVETD
jgi:hypothetical protein